MIDPIFLAALIIFVVGITNLTSQPSYSVRFACAVLPGIIILAFAAWEALLLSIGTIALSTALFILCRKLPNKSLKAFIPYLGLLPLLIPDYINAFRNGEILLLGSAFFYRPPICNRQRRPQGQI